MKPIVLVNEAAGTAAQLVGESLSDTVSRAFSNVGREVEVRQVAPGNLMEELKRAKATRRPLIVAGGDGSVSAAVQLYAGTDIPLGVIPLGTYNLLGQDLGMSSDIEEAARQLAEAEVTQVDLGRIGDRYFHTLAGLGFFSRVARQRAEVRARLPGAKLFGAAMSAIRSFLRGGSLDVEIDDGHRKQRFRTPAILITNNLLDATTWRRPRLDAGLLEINVTRGDVSFALLRGGLAALFGAWRESSDVVNWSSPQFTLNFRRPRVFLSVDGEALRLHTPLRFEIVPGALTCLSNARAAIPSASPDEEGRESRAVEPATSAGPADPRPAA